MTDSEKIAKLEKQVAELQGQVTELQGLKKQVAELKVIVADIFGNITGLGVHNKDYRPEPLRQKHSKMIQSSGEQSVPLRRLRTLEK